MKPLVSFYGGKQRMASRIVDQINRIPHTVYVEPFCGGAAVLFAKPRTIVGNRDDYREVINDSSDLLINLYRVAVKRPDDLLLELQATLYSQSDHRRAQQICKNPAGHDDLTKAWAYYVNIQMSFGNKLNGGWVSSVVSENSAATWDSRINQLEERLDRIRDIYISCEDALRCIQRWDSPQTLCYIDPPYPGAVQGHYAGYTLDDWQSLCELLDNSQCSYILSNYPQEIEPKSAQERIENSVAMSASGKGKVRQKDKSRAATAEELGRRERTEVLWICNRSQTMRKELRFANYHQASFLDMPFAAPGKFNICAKGY
jgi:DNA adenine methylase